MSDPSSFDQLMLRIEEINHKSPPLAADDIRWGCELWGNDW